MTTTRKLKPSKLFCLLLLSQAAHASFFEAARSASELNNLFTEQKQVEEMALRGAIHEAKLRANRLEARCRQHDENAFTGFDLSRRGVAAAVCAVIAADSSSLLRIAGRYDSMQRHPPAMEDRLFAEGRVYIALQDYRRACVLLELLKRKLPREPRVLFWLARAYQFQGNRSKADELYEELFRLGDFRAAFSRDPAAVDGWHYGMRLGFFAGFPDGFGIAASAFDDKAFDTDREARANAAVSLNGNYCLKGSLEDGALFPPARLAIEARLADRNRNFYGLGIDSSPDSPVLYRDNFGAFFLSARRSIFSPVSLGVGWRMRAEIRKDFAPAFASDPAQFGGPVGWLEFDTRDSRLRPWVGDWARVEGYFPSKGLGSEATFEAWVFEARHYHRLAARHRLSLGIGVQVVAGDAPFSQFADLGSVVGFPGVYVSRYRDRAASRGAVEYQASVTNQLTLGGYLTAGTVAPDAGSLLRTGWKAGAGALLEWQLSYLRGAVARIEAGRFADEWVIQAVAGSAW